jgi:hypothetical protein
MSNAEIVPPIDYSSLWLWLGVACLVSIVLIVTAILFFTRHKEPKTIASLKPATVNKDFEAIRAKYLKIIEAIKSDYARKAVSARTAHQQISLAVRKFVFEFSGIPAHHLTLTDLKKSADLNELSGLIGKIYPPEFAKVDKGSVDEASANAEEVIRKWR